MSADPERTDHATWEDKDFLLNVMGLHHFHLGLHPEDKGHMARTEDVLFASVSRDTFEILGLFDHTVFDHWTTDEEMTPERKRLWSIYKKREAENNFPGRLTIGGFGNLGITTAGTSTAVTWAAICQIRMVKEIEPKLDDPDFVRTQFGKHGVLRGLDLKWHYNHLDFGLLDKSSNKPIILMSGPN